MCVSMFSSRLTRSEGKLALVEEVAESDRSTSHGINFAWGLEPSEIGTDLILPLSPVRALAVFRVLQVSKSVASLNGSALRLEVSNESILVVGEIILLEDLA